VADPHIHVATNFNADAMTRDMVASTFGLVSDLPSTVTTGCGLTVPRAMTSTAPANVTCLACREYAHRKYLEYADQASRLADLPGAPFSAAQAHAAAEEYRALAAKFAS
jgi:hypothetical protein